MLKAFKYAIRPTNSQIILINKHIGGARFVYNLALETKQTAYAGNRVNLSCFNLINQLPDLKQEYGWLKEINAQSLQQSIRNLDHAFMRFFKGQGNFPNFKKKSNVGKFSVPQKVTLENDKLIVPKFRNGIKIVLHRPIKGIIKQATISRTPTNKYFVSILCETGELIPPKDNISENATIGVDLGIKSFLVSSAGESFENPQYLRKAQSKLKFIQRKYSLHQGKRTKRHLAILHEKVANQRKDFLHKVSTRLIRENQSIALENLNISGMIKNHNLAGAIADVSWGTFVTMLEYKAEWRGKNILRIGRFDPSSKTCSCCGAINKSLQLQDREWACMSCGAVLNRDVNAAINIKNFALRNYVSGTDTKTRNELPALVGALTSDA